MKGVFVIYILLICFFNVFEAKGDDSFINDYIAENRKNITPIDEGSKIDYNTGVENQKKWQDYIEKRTGQKSANPMVNWTVATDDTVKILNSRTETVVGQKYRLSYLAITKILNKKSLIGKTDNKQPIYVKISEIDTKELFDGQVISIIGEKTGTYKYRDDLGVDRTILDFKLIIRK